MRLQSPSLPTPTPRSGATTCGGCDSRATVRPDKPDPATGPRGRGHRRHRSTPTAHRSASQTRTRGFRAWGRRPPSPVQAMLSADDALGPPGHTAQGRGGLRCGSAWGSGGRHSPGPRKAGGPAPTLTRQVSSAPPASPMAAAASAQCACAAARPLTVTSESAGTRPRRESGTQNREA